MGRWKQERGRPHRGGGPHRRGRRRFRLTATLAVTVLLGGGFAGAASAQSGPTVNDPLFRHQHHLSIIRAPQAWEHTRGSSDVVIAVVDTGVSPTHEDLVGSLWSNAGGNHGYDYDRGRTSTYVSGQADWHGTAVAGIAAARADNAMGIAGVAPEVSLMVRRIYGSTDADSPPRIEGVSVDRAVRAIDDSVRDGADVILLTWGYNVLGSTARSQLRAAIDRAGAAGVAVVAAAGNHGRDLATGTGPYPAAYASLPNLVTVAASDRHGYLWHDPETATVASNWGVDQVDIAAPGDEIWSTDVAFDDDSGYWTFSGTSFAAPQVAAALALGRTLAPGLAVNELVGEVIRSARPQANLEGRVFSGGVLDIAEFLSRVQRPACADGVVPPAGFTDVTRESTHAFNIDCVAHWGIAEGIGDERFAPSRQITRAQMAAFLSRMLDVAGDTTDTGDHDHFDDDDGTTHEAAINRLATLGIAGGYPDGTFRPAEPVTRGQMASFLVRTYEHLAGPVSAGNRDWFHDANGTHAESINKARELSITVGSSEPGVFDPGLATRRDHMASFVARALDALARAGTELSPRS